MPNVTHIVTVEKFKYTVKIVTPDISDYSSQEIGLMLDTSINIF